ncbi:MAG: GNAT family N-acetyltransferase [Fulvivirga sp.]
MITLRPATINDLELVKYWDTQQHVIGCDPDDDWNWEEELTQDPEWREQLIAELNGEPLGFIQIIDPYLEESHYWGDVAKSKRAIDIWIGEAKKPEQGLWHYHDENGH